MSTMKIILPPEEMLLENGVFRLQEKTVKCKGEVWVVHLSDADPNPSNPHAHNEEKGEKLDLLTGNVFDIVTDKLVRKLSKKSMRYIFSQITKKMGDPIAKKLMSQKANIEYLSEE